MSEYIFPGENTSILLKDNNTSILLKDNKPLMEFKYPLLGSKCKARITKKSYICYTVSIFEVDGFKTRIEYKGIIKIENFECTKKEGEIVNCLIISYNDSGINCMLDT